MGKRYIFVLLKVFRMDENLQLHTVEKKNGAKEGLFYLFGLNC